MLDVAAQAVSPFGVAHVLGLAAVDEVHAVQHGAVVLGDLLGGLCISHVLSSFQSNANVIPLLSPDGLPPKAPGLSEDRVAIL